MKITYYSAAYLAFEAALVSSISYHLGCLIELAAGLPAINQIGGMWCMVSSLVVLQIVVKEMILQFWTRIAGALVGTIISGLISQIFGYGALQLIAIIFLSVFIMELLGTEKTIQVASTTAGTVAIFGSLHLECAAWVNAALRLLQTLAGSMVAISVVLIFSKLGFRKLSRSQS